MYADLFDQQAEELLGLLRTFGGKDFVELVSEIGKGGRIRRRVRLCDEPTGKFAFLFPEGFEARTVATDAFLADRGREVAGLEGFEVAFEPAFDPSNLGARRSELLLESRPLLGGVLRRVGERTLDQRAVAIELCELREDGCLEPVLGQPLAAAFAGSVLVAGRASVVGVPVAPAVGGGAEVGAATVVTADEPREQEVARVAAS